MKANDRAWFKGAILYPNRSMKNYRKNFAHDIIFYYH